MQLFLNAPNPVQKAAKCWVMQSKSTQAYLHQYTHYLAFNWPTRVPEYQSAHAITSINGPKRSYISCVYNDKKSLWCNYNMHILKRGRVGPKNSFLWWAYKPKGWVVNHLERKLPDGWKRETNTQQLFADHLHKWSVGTYLWWFSINEVSKYNTVQTVWVVVGCCFKLWPLAVQTTMTPLSLGLRGSHELSSLHLVSQQLPWTIYLSLLLSSCSLTLLTLECALHPSSSGGNNITCTHLFLITLAPLPHWNSDVNQHRPLSQLQGPYIPPAYKTAALRSRRAFNHQPVRNNSIQHNVN